MIRTRRKSPAIGATAPQLADYPRTLVADGRPGGEARRTIDGVPIGAAPPAESAAAFPLVSVVTVVFNNAARIERAMLSVFEQTYRNIEYIVVDGGSTDGTVDVVRRHADRLSYWHSAPDAGIADAFNRGVALARGELIGLVNSDDWMSSDQVEQAVAALRQTGAPFVFGDLIFYDEHDARPTFRIIGDPQYRSKLWHRMPQVTHPTAVVRREVYADYGLFDPQWRIGMDYDWLYRLHNNDIHGVYHCAIVGNMSLGGVSDLRNVQSLREQLSIAAAHGSPTAILALLFYLRRLKRLVRERLEAVVPQALVNRMRRLINPALSDVR